MDTQVLEQLAEALLEVTGKKVSGQKQAATNTATLLFGQGGIFSTPGIEPDVITAHVRPMGILTELPRFPSVFEQPRFATITGFTDVTGAEAVNPCDDEPSAYMKGCNLTAAFGRVSRQTQTIEWDKGMTQLHRGVTTELTLRGRLLGLGDIDPAGLSEAQAINIVTMAEMVGVGVQLERVLTRTSWQGTPANNTAGGGYREFPRPGLSGAGLGREGLQPEPGLWHKPQHRGVHVHAGVLSAPQRRAHGPDACN